MISYQELLQRQEASRLAFGVMLLSWRRRCGWTQYTACNWAKEAGFAAISYGNLSVIEQGKAGELRQKGFWQLGELNRRIADQDWGPVKSQELKARLKSAIAIGDEACPVWTPLELWACYCGLREVPEPFRASPAPCLGQRKAIELSTKLRRQLRQLLDAHGLEPLEALPALLAHAPEDQRQAFYAVLIGFTDYTSGQLAQLWIKAEHYEPHRWLAQWQSALGPQRNP